ncbi:MAG TPA: trigger factor [Caldilineales bacterium]|nr:trigger factor [Caldilineales bacterium]
MSELNITQQILEDTNELLLKVEVPQDRVNAELRKLAKKLGRRMRIPGFRPGKAPANLIIARLGREYLLQELADDLAEEVFQEAIKGVDEDKIVPGAALRHVELEPLTYEFAVPLKPEVDPGDYRAIRVPLEPVDEAEVLKRVDEELHHFLEHNKVWNPVDRPVEYGDLVTLSMKMTVDGETEIDQDEWEIIPDAEDPTLSPEFDAAIVGMEPGEKKTFAIDFPEDSDSPWAGKTTEFEVEVKGVKADELPELTDELVAENTEYETVEAFKEAVEEAARAHLARDAEQKFNAELSEKLKKGATIRYAPATLAREVELLEREREDIYKAYGFESTQQLLDLQGKSMEAYRKELEPDARTRLEDRLLLDAIAEREGFEVTQYELEQYIRDASLDSSQTEELIEAMQSNEGYREFIREIVLRRKAFKLLKAIAKGEEVPAPGEHPVEEAPEEPEAVEAVADEADEEEEGAE